MERCYNVGGGYYCTLSVYLQNVTGLKRKVSRYSTEIDAAVARDKILMHISKNFVVRETSNDPLRTPTLQYNYVNSNMAPDPVTVDGKTIGSILAEFKKKDDNEDDEEEEVAQEEPSQQPKTTVSLCNHSCGYEGTHEAVMQHQSQCKHQRNEEEEVEELVEYVKEMSLFPVGHLVEVFYEEQGSGQQWYKAKVIAHVPSGIKINWSTHKGTYVIPTSDVSTHIRMFEPTKKVQASSS